jgi:hypothetical protein
MRVLLFTAVISLATGILFGLGPLVGTTRVSAGESLKQSLRIAGASHNRLRNGLAVAQISIAITLLVGAGLLAKSFWALTHVAPGFREDGVLTARLSLPPLHYPDNQKIAAVERELLETLRTKAGRAIRRLATYMPLSGMDNDWSFVIEGRPPLPVGTYNMASTAGEPGILQTIGIPCCAADPFAGGCGGLAVGHRDQRGEGARLLGRARPDRHAAAVWIGEMAHGRRRGGRRAPRRTGRRHEAGNVRAD